MRLQALRDAFEFFINQRENKPAELIAKHIDAKLKGGSKSVTDAQMEDDLDVTLVLFRYIQACLSAVPLTDRMTRAARC